MTNTVDDPAAFYDLRGQHALSRGERKCGSAAFRDCLRSPYIYMERQLDDAYRRGARRLLDLCCGTGTHSVAAAIRGFKVRGVDISYKSIKAAIGLASEYGVADCCEFEVRSFDDFAAQNCELYDVILISGSLYYLDGGKFLGFCRDSLVKNGLFICVETYGSNRWMAVVRKMKHRINFHRDHATLTKLLGNAEINSIRSAFSSASVVYFDLCTLLACALPEGSAISRFTIRVARTVDWFILNVLRLKCLGFKFVIAARM